MKNLRIAYWQEAALLRDAIKDKMIALRTTATGKVLTDLEFNKSTDFSAQRHANYGALAKFASELDEMVQGWK